MLSLATSVRRPRNGSNSAARLSTAARSSRSSTPVRASTAASGECDVGVVVLADEPELRREMRLVTRHVRAARRRSRLRARAVFRCRRRRCGDRPGARVSESLSRRYWSNEPCQSMWSSPSEVTTTTLGARSRSSTWKLDTSTMSQPVRRVNRGIVRGLSDVAEALGRLLEASQKEGDERRRGGLALGAGDRDHSIEVGVVQPEIESGRDGDAVVLRVRARRRDAAGCRDSSRRRRTRRVPRGRRDRDEARRRRRPRRHRR